MAVVTFNSSMSGLRLQDLFTPIIDGSLSFDEEDGRSSAHFQVTVYDFPVDVFYEGPDLSEANGQVSYLRVGPSNSPWLTYGEVGGTVLFTYDDLLSFYEQDGAAAFVMKGADSLIGSSLGDFMDAYDGNDTLDGGAGADTLAGGSGDDTYIVDNSNDRTVEDEDGGHDIVRTSVNFALAEDWEIERLEAAPNALSLSLIGNKFNNEIIGTLGNDLLDGKGGIDTLVGGAGNDVYLVDNALDLVQEESGNGYDTVIAQSSYTLGDNLEALKAAAGAIDLVLTGNALSNTITGNIGANVIYGLDGDDNLYGDGGNDTVAGGNGNDLIYGGLGNDYLKGDSGRDKLYADVGNDFLYGGADSDTLYGGAGSDKLYGDDGNDILYGDVGKDTLIGGNGDDRLYGGTDNNNLNGQSGNDILYGGIHADTLYGGDGNDRLYGDYGNDALDGGIGRDTLSGGSGKDSFIFRSVLNSKTNVATITDFNVRDDTIKLENAIFKKLTKTGYLSSSYFVIGSKAHDKNDYLIYNKGTGNLYYDPDGSGHSSAVLFAKLKPGLALTGSDFLIF